MFQKLSFKNPFQLFLTILLPFLISSLALLAIQSDLLNRNFENFALQSVFKQQKNELQNTSENVQSMARTLNALATTAYFDTLIDDLLYSSIEEEDYVKYATKLQSYKNIYPFLQSIYIYNGQTVYAVPNEQFAYSRATFTDRGIFPFLDDIKKNPSHSIVLRQIPNVLYGIMTNAPRTVNVYSYLFFDTPLSKGKASEAIVLNISEDWIKQTIHASDLQLDERRFIVDANGQLLSRDNDQPLLSNLGGKDYMQAIHAAKTPSGSFRMKVDGVDSFVTYTKTGVLGWDLISMAPYEKIVHEIANMRKKTLLLMALFLAGSMLLTLYLSRRLYKPVSLVIQNYNDLESEKKDEFFDRKQNFLYELVHSSEPGSVPSLERSFHKYHIALATSGPYLLLLFRIDHYAEFCSEYGSKDRRLLKFGLMNIVSELFGGIHGNECIDMEEDQMLVVLNYPAEKGAESGKDWLVDLLREVQKKTAGYLRLTVTITISESFEAISDLNFTYLKALNLSFYRLISGHQSIISESGLPPRSEEFKYPQQQEKELTEALIQGSFQEAGQLLSDITSQASKYSYTILNSVLIRLLLSIRYAIEVLEVNHAIKVNFNFNAYLSKLQTIETLDKIVSDFRELFDQLAQELEAKKAYKHALLLDEVNALIQRDFANPGLSLELIADQVGLSSAYLGKVFKRNRQMSMTDCINQVRLNYATEQIATTDRLINEIMEQSGFLSRSNFFTLFKKAHGLTPSQYRTHAKKGSK